MSVSIIFPSSISNFKFVFTFSFFRAQGLKDNPGGSISVDHDKHPNGCQTRVRFLRFSVLFLFFN